VARLAEVIVADLVMLRMDGLIGVGCEPRFQLDVFGTAEPWLDA